MYYVLTDSGLLTPSCHRHSIAINCQQSIGSFITSLFLRCGPNTIAGLVVAIAIFAFNGVFGAGLPAHIGQEVVKAVAPSLTNRNAASAIVGIRRILAPCDHAPPRVVFWCALHSVPRLYGVSGERLGNSHATAIIALTTPQVASRNRPLNAAFASAEPQKFLSWCATSQIKNCPESKLLPSQVFAFWADGDRFKLSHEMFLSSEGLLWLEPTDVCASDRLASFYQLFKW